MSLIYIATPLVEFLPRLFMQSLFTIKHDLEEAGHKVVVSNCCGSEPIGWKRCILVKQAQRVKADYILFLDSDLSIPMDAGIKLLGAGKDVICGIYHHKEFPYKPLVKKDGKWFQYSEYLTEVTEVDAVPTGCLLIKMSVFDKIPEPWFKWECDWENYEVDKNVSDDIYFSRKCIKAGIKIWCDTSIRCGHIGGSGTGASNWFYVQSRYDIKNDS